MKKLIFILFLPISLFAQIDSTEIIESQIQKVSSRIDFLYTNSQSELINKRSNIPLSVKKFMLKHSRSKKGNKYLFFGRFMVNPNSEYRSDDVKNSNSPTRRLVFGHRAEDELYFIYKHGGRGLHSHLVYAIRENGKWNVSAFLIPDYKGSLEDNKFNKPILHTEKYTVLFNRVFSDQYSDLF